MAVQLILAVDLMPTVRAPHAMVSAVKETAWALGRVGLAAHLLVLATPQISQTQTTTWRSLASTASKGPLASSIVVGMSQMRVLTQAQAPLVTCAKTRLGTS